MLNCLYVHYLTFAAKYQSILMEMKGINAKSAGILNKI